MPSFRSRVFDALDIKKETVKVQVHERFPKTHSTSAAGYALLDTSATPVLEDYAISKELKSTVIGPSWVVNAPTKTKLDVLGFVIGNGPKGGTDQTTYKNTYPVIPSRTADWKPDEHYTGFHHLGGIYDSQSQALKHIRKSSVEPTRLDTMSVNATLTNLPEHSHKDWPDNPMDQLHLLNENPYADSLFYHSIRLSFLLTGITIPEIAESATNHRGLVRMLVIKPKMPTVKVRFTGDSNDPVINMKYPPHWDTDLFYSGKRTLGGRMDKDVKGYTSGSSNNAYSHMSPTFGLVKRKESDPTLETDTGSIHYGHVKPSDGEDHDFTSYDMLTAPINRDAYSVIVDKTFSLDTLHHGVASQRVENVTIPINNRIKFGGRQPGTHTTGSTYPSTSDKNDITKWGHDLLSEVTYDEPLNMHARPIIMFLSMDQKISCQVTGYTAITET